MIRTTFLLSVFTFFTIVAKTQSEFLTIWNTSNPGISNSDQITLPLIGTYDISWEEVSNSANNGTLSNQTDQTIITFPNSGIYQISLTGSINRVNFNNGGDKEKILEVLQWGDNGWTTFANAFYGCSNLVITASDAPDLSNVTNVNNAFKECISLSSGNFTAWNVFGILDVGGMFNGASLFNEDISNWAMNTVESTAGMFRDAVTFNQDISNWTFNNLKQSFNMFNGASSFDQNLGNWNMSNIIGLANMLDYCGMSPENYDNTLIGWQSQNLPQNKTLGAIDLKYCDSDGARDSIIQEFNWTIDGDRKDLECTFWTTWKTDNPGPSNDDQITIPGSGTYKVYVQSIADSSINAVYTGVDTMIFTLPDTGIFHVGIYDGFDHIQFDNDGDVLKIVSIEYWGPIQWTSLANAFWGCANLTINASDSPDLFLVTSLNSMFRECSMMTSGNFSSWNLNGIEDVGAMFNGCTLFNEDLNAWDMTTVTSTAGMFRNATTFNQDISGWSFTTLWQAFNMFRDASSFDQNLGVWNMSTIVNLHNMLDSCGMSPTNYDNTLIGWHTQTLPMDITLGAKGMKFCEGDAARDTLMEAYNWTMDGDVKDLTCTFWTTWKTDNEGPSNDNEISIPAIGMYSGYWEEVGNPTNNGTFDGVNTTLVTFPNAGTYHVGLYGNLEGIQFPGGSYDRKKIISLEQWGSTEWIYLSSGFNDCSNLVYNADDAPDLSNVTDLSKLFEDIQEINANLNNWDVSNIDNMNSLFSGIYTLPNLNISDWDVSNVEDMGNLFAASVEFNSDIGSWDVSRVKDMDGMFVDSDFNQDIGIWQVDSVVNMSAMFSGAVLFNQDISGWNVGQVTNMNGIFEATLNFNQDLSAWDISNVTNMGSAFSEAKAYDHSLGDWDISSVTSIDEMLKDNGMSSASYDSTLLGWYEQGPPSNLSLGALLLKYCSEAARDSLIEVYNWTIEGDRKDLECTFWTTWKTNNQGPSNNNEISIPAIGMYSGSWEEVGNPINNGTFEGVNTTLVTFPSAGTYHVGLYGNLEGIQFPEGNYDRKKIISLENWGNTEWIHLAYGFNECSNLVYNADDAPDLSNVTDLSKLFNRTNEINADLNNWDVSEIEDMNSLFSGIFASANLDISDWDVGNVEDMVNLFDSSAEFNSDIGSWDVSRVKHMNGMFIDCEFNQDIGLWQVDSVVNMRSMFSGATLFNQDISGWNLGQVTDINGMFEDAQTFNQDLSDWDMSNVTNMGSAFSQAIAYDHSLGDWDISSVTNISEMLKWCGMSSASYDSTLIGWYEQDPPIDLHLGADELIYCNSSTKRAQLISEKGWIIEGDTLDRDCAFLTTWNTQNPGVSNNDQIHLPLTGTYDGFWEDIDDPAIQGTFSGVDTITLTFPSPGIYQVGISGELTGIRFKDFVNNDRKKLLSLDHWGPGEWTSLNQGFNKCENFKYKATDAPDLGNVISLKDLFHRIDSIGGDLNIWDVSTITNMQSMFSQIDQTDDLNISDWDVSKVKNMSTMFSDRPINVDIANWDVGNVEFMSNMFLANGSFNQDISNWDVSRVKDMSGMFWDSKFNQDISSWQVDSVKNMEYLFSGTEFFDQDISSWNTSQVTKMEGIFQYSKEFNQDLSTWDVSNVTNMAFAFEFSRAFDHSLGSWDISSVTDMTNMLHDSRLSRESYDATLIGWETQNPPTDLSFSADGLEYCEGEEARDSLIQNYGWMITGDEKYVECNCHIVSQDLDNTIGSLYYAIDVCPENDTIFIDEFLDTIHLSSILPIINDTIAIVGNGVDMSTINAEDLNQCFEISEEGYLYLNGIKIIGSNATEGSAIEISGKVDLGDVIIIPKAGNTNPLIYVSDTGVVKVFGNCQLKK